MSLRTRWRPGDAFLVRHKDDDLVVVDKKAGLLTVATPSGRGPNLMALVQQFLGGQKTRARAIPVHRLDRPVSGLIVIARHEASAALLTAQFAEHSVEREYIAAVFGIVQKDEGSFESRLKSDGLLRMRSGEEGQVAITHYRVLERFLKRRVTVVAVTLETGRRNQIRVHFSEAGHPLLGEKKYLDERDARADSRQGAQRVFLHAATLGFTHPGTGERMRFVAPLPPDLVRWRTRILKGDRGARR